MAPGVETLTRRLDVYGKASASRAKPSTRVVTLPLGQFAVAGRVFATRAEAEALARKLDHD